MSTQTDAMTTPDVPADVEPDHRWVVRLWVVVVAFLAVTLVRSWMVDIPLRDVHGSILRTRLATSVLVFVAAVLVDAAWRTPRPGWSPRGALATLRTRWTLRRVGLLWSGLLAYHLVYFSYHNLKSWDVLNAPRDDHAARWDRWLFLGHSPAVLLHDLLGQDVAAWVLMVCYESFPTMVTSPSSRRWCSPTRMRKGYVFMASTMWVWILGVGSLLRDPVAGPVRRGAAGVRRAAAHHDPGTQERYMAPAGPPARGPAAPRRVRPGVGVRQPARRGDRLLLADGSATTACAGLFAVRRLPRRHRGGHGLPRLALRRRRHRRGADRRRGDPPRPPDDLPRAPAAPARGRLLVNVRDA